MLRAPWVGWARFFVENYGLSYSFFMDYGGIAGARMARFAAFLRCIWVHL